MSGLVSITQNEYDNNMQANTFLEIDEDDKIEKSKLNDIELFIEKEVSTLRNRKNPQENKENLQEKKQKKDPM